MHAGEKGYLHEPWKLIRYNARRKYIVNLLEELDSVWNREYLLYINIEF